MIPVANYINHLIGQLNFHMLHQQRDAAPNPRTYICGCAGFLPAKRWHPFCMAVPKARQAFVLACPLELLMNK